MITSAEGTRFVWNRDYHDTEQVRPFMAAYLARRAEIVGSGEYPYNDSFRGHLGILGEEEDRAIYLCQRLYALDELRAQVDAAIVEGFAPALREDLPLRGSVIQYGWYVGGTGFKRWDDVRVVPAYGTEMAVLPPRARTRGHILQGTVLIKPAR